jgi:hypothetical protein
MATPDEYAKWIVANEAKKGTPEFNTVVQAYQDAKKLEGQKLALQQGGSTSVMNPTPEQRDILPMLKQSAIKGVAGLGDMVVGFPEDVKRLYNYATTSNVPVPQKSQPITEKLIANNTLVPQNEPNTPVLKAADFITQLAVSGGVNPVTVGRSLLTKTLPQAGMDIAKQFGRTGVLGAAGSAGSQLAESINPENQFVQAAGAMIPMVALGSINAARGTPSSISHTALKGATPEQLRMADILLKRSYAEGAPLTGAEAIAQTTGGSPIQNIQRIVESSPKGAAIMQPFMANRPTGNAQYFGRVAEEISPVQGGLDVPERMQVTAKKSIEDARKEGNVLAEPFYKASERQLVDNSTMVSLMSDPTIENAVKAVMKDPYYRVTNANPNSIQVFDAAKKYLNDKSSEFARSGNNNAASVASSAAKTITNNVDVISPDYQRARGIVQQNITDVVEPMQKLPLGKIAETTGYGEDIAGAQRNALMPADPKSLTPSEIRKTVDILNRTDPTVAKDWTRQNLESLFAQNTQNLQSGANQAGGAKFITNVAGQPWQRQNLEALITESAGSQAWKGFEVFGEVMEAQGKRQGQGSLTASNIEAQKELKGGGPIGLATVPFKPSTVRNWLEDFRYGRNTDVLAKMLTDPDSVNLIRRLAKTDPHTAKAQVIVDTLVGGNIGSNPEIKEAK